MAAIAITHRDEILERLKAHALKAERFKPTLQRLRPVLSPGGGYRMTLAGIDRDGEHNKPQ